MGRLPPAMDVTQWTDTKPGRRSLGLQGTWNGVHQLPQKVSFILWGAGFWCVDELREVDWKLNSPLVNHWSIDSGWLLPAAVYLTINAARKWGIPCWSWLASHFLSSFSLGLSHHGLSPLRSRMASLLMGLTATPTSLKAGNLLEKAHRFPGGHNRIHRNGSASQHRSRPAGITW